MILGLGSMFGMEIYRHAHYVKFQGHLQVFLKKSDSVDN